MLGFIIAIIFCMFLLYAVIDLMFHIDEIIKVTFAGVMYVTILWVLFIPIFAIYMFFFR